MLYTRKSCMLSMMLCITFHVPSELLKRLVLRRVYVGKRHFRTECYNVMVLTPRYIVRVGPGCWLTQ